MTPVGMMTPYKTYVVYTRDVRPGDYIRWSLSDDWYNGIGWQLVIAVMIKDSHIRLVSLTYDNIIVDTGCSLYGATLSLRGT